MNEIGKLAEYGSCGIAIAMIVALTYLLVRFMPFMQNIFYRMNDSIYANTKATIEMHEFLRNLNGKIRRSINKKNK